MAFRIWTDTSANLPAPLCEKLGIGVVPFHFIHNGGAEQSCLDTEAFPYEEYYADLKSGGTATTSMINSEAFREVFEREAEAGRDVLYIGMSSGISGAYGASVLAAREVGEKHPPSGQHVDQSVFFLFGEHVQIHPQSVAPHVGGRGRQLKDDDA